MISKDDLVNWFKNLESYKRIDVMCTLLNLCLPFELRFLGTCLEELGRRDAQDLRGVELRVNNPQEFVTDVGSFQSGQPTDMKIRRKMALYLALMRACNRTGVNELFKTLDRWGDRDFSKFSDGDPLQELLLVYTMATNHPVFSFEQRLKCGEIYSKITSSKAHLNQPPPPTQQQQQSSTNTSPVTSPLSSFSVQQQHQQTASPPPFQSGTFQQQPQLINPQTQQQIPNPPIQLMPMGFPQTALISSADPSTSTIALSVESLPSHLVNPSMVIPPDFTTPPPWQMRYQPQIYPTIVPIETQQPYPPPTSSPHMSQPSSPTNSRNESPTRSLSQNQPQQPSQQQSQRRGMRTRPSTETTPPPLQQQQQQTSQQGSGTMNYMGNDIMFQTTKNFDELNMDGAISQLHSLTIRNGYNRPSNTLPRNKQMQTLQWQQMQQQQHGLNFTIHMHDPMQQIIQHQHKQTTTGSDSSSSTGGDMSPPPSSQQQQQNSNAADPTIVLHGNANQSQSSGLVRNKSLNMSRLNGSGNSPQQQNSLDFTGTPTNPLVTSSSSGNLLVIGGPMHNFPTYKPATTTIQRQFPPQLNGEIAMFPFSTAGTTAFIPTAPAPVPQSTAQQQQQRVSPSQTPPVLLPTPYPTNKLVQSCFNCGSINHTGLNCSEASMEDVTRNAIYKLDYTVSNAQSQPFNPALTSTSSSGNLSQMMQVGSQSVSNNNNNNSNSNNSSSSNSNNNNIEQEPIFIDLTQDTSSDSSISNR